MIGIDLEETERRILTIHGQSVLIDATIGDLYVVTTKEVKTFHLLTNLKFSHNMPKAFIEKGFCMLGTILKAPRHFKQHLPSSRLL